ncbi:ABC transporter substrate-binding protein [Halorarius litoreus]|uniref:ABC transporter substrate-binding protein n=1 Tax=Halorarius litoreus TaxID=2962676 RepID=UPI0020CF15EF|nr:ABC transporter substrate-binding protein [Halorarius litoreus]
MVSRRRFIETGSIATALLAAGCTSNGGGDGSDGSDGGGGTDGSDGSDNGTVTGSATDEPITVGVFYPGVIPDGELTTNAAKYVRDQLNDDGGVLGREIEIVTADTKLDPETAGQEGRRLVEQEDVDFLTGGYATGPILAIQQHIAGSGPVFNASSVGGTQPLDRIANNYEQHKYFFSPVPVGPLVVSTMAANMDNVIQPQTGVENVVPVIEDHAWTKGFVDRLKQSTEMNVEDPVRFSVDTTDFSPVFSKVRDSGADLMMLGIAVANGAGFVTQWADNEVPAGMTGILVAANAPNFKEQVGEAAHYVSQQQLGAAAPITEVSLPFVEGYRERFDSTPGTTAWQTYDAFTSMMAAAEEAGTIDPDEVVASLEELVMPGTMGMLDYMTVEESDYPHNARMDPDDGVWYSMLQYQQEGGDLKNKVVGPDQWEGHDGEDEYQLPPWV